MGISGHIDRHTDLVIQGPRFVAANFLPLSIQHSDSGLRTGDLYASRDKFDIRQLFSKDLSEIKVSWCGSLAILVDCIAHISMKCCAASLAVDNSEIGMKTVLKF
jgi:hypothetical protein